jgi:hypothetical protein
VSETPRLPFSGAADSKTVGLSLADRFRRHANALVRDDRSPLCAQLMFEAAGDLDAGGLIAKLFCGVQTPPGSVPQLRLLAALHHLVLTGRAPALAGFYPSVGGELPPHRIWPAVLTTIEEHVAWISQRLHRTVQTNEPGRSTVLFAALLWLTDHYQLPIRLLEIGASAGLNLIPDRYCYLVDGVPLGRCWSTVRFNEPWQPSPDIDIGAAARRLEIVARAGCDLDPLDPRDPEDQVTLLSYIWPDELERIKRVRAALELAISSPVPVAAAPAAEWLQRTLAAPSDGELTVIWQSIFRQYVDPGEWVAITDSVRQAGSRPLVWLSMEPSDDHLAGIRLAFRVHPEQPEQLLAWCGDHGPPVLWKREATNPATANGPEVRCEAKPAPRRKQDRLRR